MGKSKPSSNKVDVDGDVSESVVISGSGNTVTINKDSLEKEPPPPKHTDTWQWIFMAVLFIAIIVVAFKSSSSNSLTGVAGTKSQTPTKKINLPSLTPSSTSTITPTSTETLSPTQTYTQTVIPTETSFPTFTPIPPVPLGDDWRQGCISKVWVAYPESIVPQERGDGCWREPVHVFSAENGDLDFLSERSSGGEEVYGLFAPLPIERGSVTFTIRLKDLTNVDLLLGIFSQPEVTSQGLLMIILNGGVKESVFIRKNLVTYETITGSRKISQDNGYSITFHFDNLSARAVVNPSVFFIDPISIPTAQKYLFLGYKGLRGYYRIEGTFLNFELKP